MIRFFQNVLSLAEKDIRVELKSRESFFSTLLFVALVLVIASFSFDYDPAVRVRWIPGILWIVVAFSGSIALSSLVQRDTHDGFQDALLLTGVGSMALFFSKFIWVLLFMLFIEVISVGLISLFFNFSWGPTWPLLAMIMVLGSVGYVALGVLFASLLRNTRTKELLLPLVLYPIVIPLLIACVHATEGILSGDSNLPIPFFFGFDIIFVTASALLYDYVVEEL